MASTGTPSILRRRHASSRTPRPTPKARLPLPTPPSTAASLRRSASLLKGFSRGSRVTAVTTLDLDGLLESQHVTTTEDETQIDEEEPEEEPAREPEEVEVIQLPSSPLISSPPPPSNQAAAGVANPYTAEVDRIVVAATRHLPPTPPPQAPATLSEVTYQSK